MHFALPCAYRPKHAAPREPLGLEARSVLAVGLAAAVLPLGAAPALADEVRPTGTTAGADQQAAAPAATGSSTGSATPTATTAATPKASASPKASAAPAASPKASAGSAPRQSTSLSFSAPTSARSTAVPVGIRLLANGKGVRNGYVRLEKATPKGWTYAGRLLTNGDGVGKGTLKVAGSTKLRAAYTGSQVRTPAVSQARTVRAAATGSAILDEAAKHVGKPYRYGAVGPDSFDCSGFTRYVYAKATGKSLPHNSRAQESMATPVSKADARPGDLVFIQDVAGHVGIYAGNGKMYDAPRSGKTVTLRSIWTSNYTVGRP